MKFKAYRTIGSKICSVPCPEGVTVDLPDELAKSLEARGLGVAGGAGRPKKAKKEKAPEPVVAEPVVLNMETEQPETKVL